MNALVVGLGRMGTFHSRVLRDLGYQTTTVDPDPEKDADYPRIAEARLAASPLSGFKYDVACIATPAEHLLDSAYQLAGIPMLVEKPFALTSQSAWMLAAHLKQAGAPVCVGYVERFNPVVREIRKARDAKPMGLSGRFTRWSDRPSWNTALDLQSHDVDLAMWALGLDYKRCTFDVRAEHPIKSRMVTLNYVEHFDLMDHDLSPLHAMWHAFLTGKPVPTPSEAARVLQVIESMDHAHEEIAA